VVSFLILVLRHGDGKITLFFLEHIFTYNRKKVHTIEEKRERGGVKEGLKTHTKIQRGENHYFMECDDVLGVKKERVGLVFDATHRVE